VQHPEGQKKQVALRDNRIVDVLDNFLHYEADTQPGSSGSPVFNDQWDLVALHHASVPAPDHPELGKFVNEGIRVSRLLAFIAAQTYTADQQQLVTELLGGGPVPESVAPARAGLTAPLQITIRVEAQPSPTADPPCRAAATGGAQQPAAAGPRYVLPYHHYSVVLNKDRRLAFFTAVNIDGASGQRLRREPDHWFFDPRVPQDQQTGEQVYVDNPLDRGHLVRRLDPAWGPTAAVAKTASDDTFHFTNCTPQHHDFNAGQTLWAGLEDYILDSADNLRFRVNVFSGPVLAADDDQYRGVQLPRQFWKVVAMAKQDGTLSVTAYLLSQE
jgi:endonuclease G